LFPNARKAYLYDPVANKILEVAPINLGDTGPAVDSASVPATGNASESPPEGDASLPAGGEEAP
jgi:hypothetical protein